MKKENWIKEVLYSISELSRTTNGVSDTSSSVNKPSLEIKSEGELALHTQQNLINALKYLWENRNNNFQSSDNVKLFIDEVARLISDGLLKPGQSLFRTWDTKFKQTRAVNIEKEYTQFCYWLFEALQTEKFVETAALVEKRLDGKIHPFADGCSRTAKSISVYILLKTKIPVPKYPSREVYYREINKSDPEWINFYRSLFKGKSYE